MLAPEYVMTIPAPIGETCAAEVVSAVPRSAVCSARPVNLCRTANLSVLCNSLSREESLVVYRFGDIVAAVSGLAQLVLPRLLLSPSPVAQPDFRTSCPAISRASSLKNRKPVVQSLSVMIRLHVGGGGIGEVSAVASSDAGSVVSSWQPTPGAKCVYPTCNAIRHRSDVSVWWEQFEPVM